jgi:hypothetical protein
MLHLNAWQYLQLQNLGGNVHSFYSSISYLKYVEINCLCIKQKSPLPSLYSGSTKSQISHHGIEFHV